MIQGQVSDKWQPMVEIGLVDADGTEISTSVLVDTGYDGDLTLPPELIDRQQMDPFGQASAQLADNSTFVTPSYFGVAVVEGQHVPLVVLEGGNPPLTGMKFWKGRRITVEAWPQGLVQIGDATE